MSNPFVSGSSATTMTTESSLPTFTEYAWDFVNDQFMFDSGKHKTLIENEALEVWIYKTLKTERWRYLAYDNDYGIELEQFIGAYANSSDNSNIIEQYISEALLINPYIKSIDDIAATMDGDSLTYTISLTTIYGTMVTSSAS